MPFEFQFEKTALSNFLGDIDYPTDKNRIIEQAKDRELPLQVIAMLQRLPEDRDFSNADEVQHELAAKSR